MSEIKIVTGDKVKVPGLVPIWGEGTVRNIREDLMGLPILTVQNKEGDIFLARIYEVIFETAN
jgi:hypothetical protein